MVSADKCAKRQSPTFFSWLVVDSMSTSARVSSKRFIRNQAFLDERNERKEPRRYNSGLPPLDSASSVSYPAAKRTAYNGRQWIGFGPIPQPPRLQLPRRFRRTKNASSDLIGRKKSPFCACLRSCSELLHGYLWPPHLYQERVSLSEPSGKSERNLSRNGFKKMIQLMLKRDVFPSSRTADNAASGQEHRSVRHVVLIWELKNAQQCENISI